MFLLAFLCLSVFMFVYKVTQRQITSSSEIFRKCWWWHEEEVIRFWCWHKFRIFEGLVYIARQGSFWHFCWVYKTISSFHSVRPISVTEEQDHSFFGPWIYSCWLFLKSELKWDQKDMKDYTYFWNKSNKPETQWASHSECFWEDAKMALEKKKLQFIVYIVCVQCLAAYCLREALLSASKSIGQDIQQNISF